MRPKQTNYGERYMGGNGHILVGEGFKVGWVKIGQKLRTFRDLPKSKFSIFEPLYSSQLCRNWMNIVFRQLYKEGKIE